MTREKVLPVLSKYPQVQEFLRAKTEPMNLIEINQRCRNYNGASSILVESNIWIHILSSLVLLLKKYSI